MVHHDDTNFDEDIDDEEFFAGDVQPRFSRSRRIWHLEDQGKKFRNIIKTRSAKGHRAQQINPTSLAYSGDGMFP